jgi:hypothetical protein
LLRVLATRENLDKVFLDDTAGIGLINYPGRITPFLLAIQQNPRVKHVKLRQLLLSGDLMASFLDAAASIATLELEECDIMAPGGVLAVAAALQRNSNIQRLKLDDRNKRNLIPILNSLASSTQIMELSLVLHGPSLNISLAVKHLLVSTTTIQRFNLNSFRATIRDFRDFHLIAQGLIQSKSITHVELEDFFFYSQEAKLALKSILESKSNLQSLSFRTCHIDEDWQSFMLQS